MDITKVLDVETIWYTELQRLADEKEDEFKKANVNNVYRVSSVGGCYKKTILIYEQAEYSQMFFDSAFNTHVGNLFHESIQSAMVAKFKEIDKKLLEMKIEHKVDSSFEGIPIKGSIDLLLMFNDLGIIVDLKTTKAYQWQKLFGQKKNRDPRADEKYQLQTTGYLLGMHNELGADFDIQTYLYYIKKDDSSQKYKEVLTVPSKSLEIEEIFKQYFRDVEGLRAMVKNGDELVGGEDMGCPIQKWECNYCSFWNRCKSPLTDIKRIHKLKVKGVLDLDKGALKSE